MTDESLEALAKQVADLKEAAAQYDAVYKETSNEADELRTKINDLINKANDAYSKARIKKDELRNAERHYKTAEAKQLDELKEQEAENRFKNLSLQMDEIIGKFVWKDRALQHQIIGAKRLAIAERAILGDRPGLGKTLTSLMVADLRGMNKLVIVTPPDVGSNFIREIRKWTDRMAVSIIGKNALERDFMLEHVLPDTEKWCLVVSYSTWRRDLTIADKINSLNADMIIADEAHYVKSRETKAFKGLKKITGGNLLCSACGSVKPPYVPGMGQIDCCENADYVNSVKQLLLMTGTPLVNKPQDLYSLLYLSFPDRFKQERDFLDRYCQQDFYTQKWYFRPGGLDALIKQMSAYFVARTREDAGIVIPPQEIIFHEFEFDAAAYPNQARVIQQLREKAMLVLNEKDDFGQPMELPMQYILQLITRQRQAIAFPDGIEFKDKQGTILYKADANGESMKIDKAMELILEITENGDEDPPGTRIGERVVVFSQFKGTLNELHKRCKAAGVASVIFNGDTPEALRNRIKLDVDRDATDPKKSEFQVVLAHYRTGGVGLNMTGITNLLVLDETWNPASRDQAYGRVDRMGQTEETTVHVLRVKQSIDTWLAGLIEDKQKLVDGFDQQAGLASALLDAMMSGEM